MGQFLDYLASVFTNKVEANNNGVTEYGEKTNESQSFGKYFQSKSTKVKKLASMVQRNTRTIYIYQTIGAIAFFIQLSMVTVPKLKSETFNVWQPDGWQHLTLAIAPFVVFLGSIVAMSDINKHAAESEKMTPDIAELDFDSNELIPSLKMIIILISLCQLSTLVSDQLLWSVVMIVPFWCYHLTLKLAHKELSDANSAPGGLLKKILSPTKKSPTKAKEVSTSGSSSQNDGLVNATPRTRTKKAVKNIINGVSDKYHAIEQNIAQQISQKVFQPIPKHQRMIEN